MLVIDSESLKLQRNFKQEIKNHTRTTKIFSLLDLFLFVDFV